MFYSKCSKVLLYSHTIKNIPNEGCFLLKELLKPVD